jgi:hypothetical protein
MPKSKAPRRRRPASLLNKKDVVPPRRGVEVFRNRGGTVSIAQIAELPHEDADLVVVHHEDLPKLIGMLNDIHREYLQEAKAAQPPPVGP